MPKTFQHAEGGLYVLVSDTAVYKDDGTDEWVNCVVYSPKDMPGKLFVTSTQRWLTRFREI